MERKTVTSYDGTGITYEVGGRGDRWLVIANGYGGSFWAWRDLFAVLEDRYRILIWDYRGFYSSGTPADLANLRIEDNCRDLDCILEAEGVERYVLGGWSVGVQVALEQYRRRPDSVDALLLINGSHGRVLHRSGNGRLSGVVMPRLIGPWSRVASLAGPRALAPLRLLMRTPKWVKLFGLLGLVDGTPDSIHEALQAVFTLDWGVYLRMAKLADEHDTEDMLPTVAVPTLVTSGGKDVITPPRIGAHVAARIPGAKHFVVPSATHYAVMEHPRLMANKMDTFLRAIGT